MNEETIDFLRENLDDAHYIFCTIISEMQDANIPFEYEIIKEKEMISVDTVKDYLIKMNHEVYEYNMLEEDNIDIINTENETYFKYFMLYVISIVFIKLFHEIFSKERFNEFWHYLVGLFLGSTYMVLLSKDINENRSNTKEKRDLFNRLKTLREEYKKNHDNAVIEIDYLFALNDNLWDELNKGKKLVKNK